MYRIYVDVLQDVIDSYVGTDVSIQLDGQDVLFVPDETDLTEPFAFKIASGLGAHGTEDISDEIYLDTLSDFLDRYAGEGALKVTTEGAHILIECCDSDGQAYHIADKVKEYDCVAKVWGRWKTTVYAASEEDAKERASDDWYEADFGELYDIDAEIKVKK